MVRGQVLGCAAFDRRGQAAGAVDVLFNKGACRGVVFSQKFTADAVDETGIFTHVLSDAPALAIVCIG